jgi:hypothetical protein
MIIYIYIFLLLTSIITYIFNKHLEIYHFGKKSPESTKILILGGTHGNEPSSILSLYKLIHYLRQESINSDYEITVIPMINKLGFYTNNRYNYHFFHKYDINRNYPNMFYINKILDKYIRRADIIIDNHEGYNYHIDDKKSIGSTISLLNMDNKIFKKILKNLNKYINKKIIFNTKKYIPKNSLRFYIQNTYSKKKYVLIETTGITNREPIKLRQYKTLYIIISLLKSIKVVTK